MESELSNDEIAANAAISVYQLTTGSKVVKLKDNLKKMEELAKEFIKAYDENDDLESDIKKGLLTLKKSGEMIPGAEKIDSLLVKELKDVKELSGIRQKWYNVSRSIEYVVPKPEEEKEKGRKRGPERFNNILPKKNK